jgi:hypothetical protein
MASLAKPRCDDGYSCERSVWAESTEIEGTKEGPFRLHSSPSFTRMGVALFAQVKREDIILWKGMEISFPDRVHDFEGCE